jgi:hypothetical protein
VHRADELGKGQPLHRVAEHRVAELDDAADRFQKSDVNAGRQRRHDCAAPLGGRAHQQIDIEVTDNGGRGEHVALCAGDAIEATRHHSGHTSGDNIGTSTPVSAGIVQGERARPQVGVQDLFDEEGDAVRAGEHLVHELSGWSGGQQRRQQVLHVAQRQGVEAPHLGEVLTVERADNLIRECRFAGPEGAHNQNPGDGSARQVADALEALRVGGMQIVQNEYRPPPGGDVPDQVDQALEGQETKLAVGQARRGIDVPFRQDQLQAGVEHSP